MPAPSVGDTLAGKYRLTRELGRGGMGVVFEATQLDLGRSVAVKVLSPGAADEATLGRFQREVSILARISHPHIVPVFDFGRGDDVTPPFLAMELLRGRTLAQLTQAEGRLAPARAARIVMQLLEALAAAHAQGILHRDVKPANVFCVETQLAGDFVKLLDFGVAKDLTASSPLTVAGNLVGTFSYLAPELLLGEPATYQTDVYAAGATLYYALSGKSPFLRSTPAEIADAIRDGDAVPIERLRHDTRPALAAVVGRAIAVSPSSRFESVAAMHEALASAVEPAAPAHLAPPPEQTATTRKGADLPPAPAPQLVESTQLSAGPAPSTPGAERRPASPSRVVFVLAGLAACVAVISLALVLHIRREDGPRSALAAPSASSSVAVAAPSVASSTSASQVPAPSVAAEASSSSPAAHAASAPRHLQYSGVKAYRSAFAAPRCDSLDVPTYRDKLDALAIASCFVDAAEDPPIHQYPQYVVHAEGTRVTRIDASDGSPRLDVCMRARLQSVALPRPASAGACTVEIGYTARCPHDTWNGSSCR